MVNCSGLGATTLAHDPQLTPVRGQHVIVDAPWLTEFVYEGGAEDHWVGVMPHGRRVVLGGVAQPGDRSLAPDPVITEQILRRCIAVVPELAAAPVLGVEVGIRPGRPRVRLERVDIGSRAVVHNYGHAGNGVMLSWGCADAVDRSCAGLSPAAHFRTCVAWAPSPQHGSPRGPAVRSPCTGRTWPTASET